MTVEDQAFWKLQTIARMAAQLEGGYCQVKAHVTPPAGAYVEWAVSLYTEAEAALTPKEPQT